jgi:hypothetical protein
MFDEGVTFISKWAKCKKHIIILDNGNWFVGKLATWGDTLGVPKLEMPEEAASEADWFTYCERDTEILYKLQSWLIRFIEDNDLGNWQLTRASLAFSSYRHRFMLHNIYIPASEMEAQLSRKSYKGGRTECFYVGNFNHSEYYKLDVNSMYPYVMRENEYPVNWEAKFQSYDVRKLPDILSQYGCIADATVCTDIPYFGYTIDKRTVYPVGLFDTTLTTPEIKLALTRGWLKEVHTINFYRMRPVFTEFVDFFYGERMQWKEKGDVLREQTFKLLLNSLYGKFGQRGYDDKLVGRVEEGLYNISYGYDADKNEHYLYRQVGKNVIRSVKSGEGYNAFVAIASHVTAYARIYLYNLIEKAGRNNAYYCDTDSLFVNRQGYINLLDLCHPTELGKLKLEATSNELVIKAPKHYYFAGHWTRKGVRPNAEVLGDDTFRQEIWPSSNRIISTGKEEYYNYFQTKRLNPQIKSGHVQPDGRVTPFIITN